MAVAFSGAVVRRYVNYTWKTKLQDKFLLVFLVDPVMEVVHSGGDLENIGDSNRYCKGLL